MIRKMTPDDLQSVVEIWLEANLEAHDFITPSYWIDNKDEVKNALAQAEVYVYEKDTTVAGFVGLDGTYIAGIFVSPQHRSSGIGKALLDYIKDLKPDLTLGVYQKNERAIKFYKREGFAIKKEDLDKVNDEKEYMMTWEK
ncbi:N-acetyltransferase [Vagococcus fessus]|uniref:N-acetyltransferase n=1 Tax=Vagococcus fessus TaxID=120370 RepID=A0A430A6F6_9ENTE|nr:N-acetyltransferase [Vagococcus fessus]RSU02441.1 N-acetyltransferase [Vagococcus fessus]